MQVQPREVVVSTTLVARAVEIFVPGRVMRDTERFLARDVDHAVVRFAVAFSRIDECAAADQSPRDEPGVHLRDAPAILANDLDGDLRWRPAA